MNSVDASEHYDLGTTGSSFFPRVAGEKQKLEY